jgi:hypothetical protein
MLLLNIIILFKFTDWALELFSKKVQTGVNAETGRIIDSARTRFEGVEW